MIFQKPSGKIVYSIKEISFPPQSRRPPNNFAFFVISPSSGEIYLAQKLIDSTGIPSTFYVSTELHSELTLWHLKIRTMCNSSIRYGSKHEGLPLHCASDCSVHLGSPEFDDIKFISLIILAALYILII